MSIKLADFDALTFDCYGTLIDWETGLLDVLRRWAKASSLNISDDALLQVFSETEPVCEHARPTAPYRDILRDVQRAIAIRYNVQPNDDDANRLANSVGDWPAFPDTVDALRRLKCRHKLVIVSNVDRVSFARTAARLQIQLDAVVTAEEVGAYKPDHRIFYRAFEVLEKMGVARSRILHVAESLYHDHVPAKVLGMKTVQVHRRRGRTGSGATPAPQSKVTPDLTVATLAELAAIDVAP